MIWIKPLCTVISKEIIDNQDLVLRWEEFVAQQ